MKHCNGNYFSWGIQEDMYLSDDERLIPNPKCFGCEYSETCIFRVTYWLEYKKDMPERDVEIIHTMVQEGKKTKKIILN